MEYVKTILLAAVTALVVLVGASLVGDNQPENLGAGTRFPNGISADSTAPSAGQIRGTSLTSTDDVTVGDDLTVSGQAVVAGQVINTPDGITATTTLTADSSTIQFLATSSAMATITLPPVSVSGTMLTFVVTGPLTGSSVVIDSAEGDNIEGILMVNDADVVCEGEDQLNIVTDGEVIGDRVSLISNGGNWFILDSDVDAAGKMTCTDPS